MMYYLRLIASFLRLGALNEFQYRANFFMQVVNSLLELASALGGLGLIYYHVETLNGWRPYELLAVVGVYIMIGGIINMIIVPNMWRIFEDVREGKLDFKLTKPADSQVMVSFNQFQVWKVVDVLEGLVVLIIAIVNLGQTVGPLDALAFVLTLVCGGVIVYSLWLMIATSAFWVVRAWQVFEFFESIYQTGRWPVDIYPGWLRIGLTFIVPVAFAVTVPAEALTGRLTGGTLALVVGIAAALFIISRAFWKFGLTHYSGASA